VSSPPLPPSDPGAALPGAARAGHAFEVLRVFLRLGLGSFGGPVAHVGYFRAEFVERRRWLDDRSFGDLVALCQFLPGPASSQVGLAIGLLRAGWMGALAAWAGFTLPSAAALVAFAYGVAHASTFAASGALHGLKVVAVAVVAQAVWGMARSLCPDRPRAALAIVAALLTLASRDAAMQVALIAGCALVGRLVLRLPAGDAPGAPLHCPISRRTGIVALVAFFALLGGLPLLAGATHSLAATLLAGFYRAGALVFGGGHVVLPLLQSSVVAHGVVSDDVFLAGYGAAQAVPGPLFSFAAYLGAVLPPPLGGWRGGLACLLAIYLPAVLLVVGALPFWNALRQRVGVRAALAGVNAGVVGLLLAALYDPVWTSAIHARADFGLALAAFGLLAYARVSPVIVVVLGALGGWALG
jgi:chromate transporter